MIAPTLLSPLAVPAAAGVAVAAPGDGDVFASLFADLTVAPASADAAPAPPGGAVADKGQTLAAPGIALPAAADLAGPVVSSSSSAPTPIDARSPDRAVVATDAAAAAPSPRLAFSRFGKLPSRAAAPSLPKRGDPASPTGVDVDGRSIVADLVVPGGGTASPQVIVDAQAAPMVAASTPATAAAPAKAPAGRVKRLEVAAIPIPLALTPPTPAPLAPDTPQTGDKPSARLSASADAGPIVEEASATMPLASPVGPMAAADPTLPPPPTRVAATPPSAGPAASPPLPAIDTPPATSVAVDTTTPPAPPVDPAAIPATSPGPVVVVTPVPLPAPAATIAPMSTPAPGPAAGATPPVPVSAPAAAAAAAYADSVVPLVAGPVAPAPTPAARRDADSTASAPARPVAPVAPSIALGSAQLVASPAIGTTAPARQLFAAAIEAADRQQRIADRPLDPITGPTATLTTSSLHVAAAGSSAGDQAGLDMRQGNWPGAMIDHIERLRDAANASDTRIRLVPDALGGIDVSLRRHDDGVQVTLAADQPATRAMLAEARPQLAAMAEARGIRLADAPAAGSSTGSGPGLGDASTAGGRQPQPQAQPQAQPNPAPRSLLAATDDDPDPADGRVA